MLTADLNLNASKHYSFDPHLLNPPLICTRIISNLTSSYVVNVLVIQVEALDVIVNFKKHKVSQFVSLGLTYI